MQAIKQLNIHQPGWQRRTEITVILLFVIASPIFLFMSQGSPETLQYTGAQASKQVSVQINAMPNQGWAPLTVYFSSFGSQTTNEAHLLRYEWDLDGNGMFDFDATRQNGYARYTYSKPGEYPITLRITDSQGHYATAFTMIQVRHPASSSVDYWTLFSNSRVRRIEFQLTQSDWQSMWVNPEAKTRVHANAIIFGERLESISLRMRGQFSLRESGDKKPWKIDTDAYISGQEFHNLRQLLFLNNIGDPSFLREKLAYEMMAFAGVPASHTTFVELWIDLTDDPLPPFYWGIYTLVERIDRKYLGNRFGQASKDGNLYKASHAQRGPMDLIYYGNSISDYPTQNGQYAYGKMNNEAQADYSDIINLCLVIDGTTYDSEEELVQALEEVINVDGFLRYLAVITILDNWDSYLYTGNNYFLFNNPVSGRFEWLPWDLTWGENTHTPLFTRAGQGIIQRAPLYDRVFSVDSYRRKYAAYIDLLAHYWFNPDYVTNLVQEYQRMLTPYIKQSGGDKAFYGAHPMFPAESYQDSWQKLVHFTRERHKFIQAELKTFLER